MDRRALTALLEGVRAGQIDPSQAVEDIAGAADAELGAWAKIDGHRALRSGLPEVVYGEGKTAEQCALIARELDRQGEPVLVTRLSADKASIVCEAVPDGRYDPTSRLFHRSRGPDPHPLRGPIAVLCAGTSDVPVAEEAALTLETIGQPVERMYDVGVAGLHRLLSRMDVLKRAGAVIVVAGMEGALPSVVGGLVSVPCIAVPTSVGYGANFNGLSALLGMLNSCTPAVSVVNIGNGFGAACVAALANRIGPPVKDTK